jgi:hypothetical protein
MVKWKGLASGNATTTIDVEHGAFDEAISHH